MEKVYQENQANHIKQSGKPQKRGSQLPTTQRLDGEDKDNQRTPQLLVITTQE